MKLKLTDEQLQAIYDNAPEGAKYFAIGANCAQYYYPSKPLDGRYDWYPANNGLGDGEISKIEKIENWRELCFEIPKKQKQEKPVNEACLFKPVLVKILMNESWIEGLLIGILNCNGNKFVVAIKDPAIPTSEHGYNGVVRYSECKRIPGYDYGDNDES